MAAERSLFDLGARVARAVRWRALRGYRRLRTDLHEYRRAVRGRAMSQSVDQAELDPRVRYPSYRSMDEFIDVERLHALDGYVRERVTQTIADGAYELFHTGRYRRRLLTRAHPGSKNIPLSQPNRPYAYENIGNPEAWGPSPVAERFPELMDFIRTLPFAGTARMLIMCDEQGRAVPGHRDHPELEMCNEFIWFRTSASKPFYVESSQTGERRYVTSTSAWFDTVNQFHGADATGRLAISIRVDGVFDDALRARIPTPTINRASTAALWDAVDPA